MSESASSSSLALPAPSAFDNWVLSKLMNGEKPNSVLLNAVSVEYQKIVKYLSVLPLEERAGAYREFESGAVGSDELRRRLRGLELAKSATGPIVVITEGSGEPAPTSEAARAPDPVPVPAVDVVVGGRYPASVLDLSLSSRGVRWLWEGWISRGRIAGLAGFEGTGKSRFALDLARRVYHGLPAPDGRALGVEAGLPSLWICADGHQDELGATAKEMGIPPEAVLFNADPEDPYGGVDLDSPGSLEQLEEFLAVSKAPLVFVDTLTNATRRDLCRQNDVKSLLGPLVEIAQRRDVAIILLLHLSREGQALGRRVKGLTRTLLHLECSAPDARPDRLRLWVEKSFTVKPPSLGVTMTAGGNEYDTSPPGKVDRGGLVRQPSETTGQAAEFLLAELADGDRKACDLVSAWEARGGSRRTVFRAKDSLVEDGRVVVDDSRKPQIWHLVKTG